MNNPYTAKHIATLIGVTPRTHYRASMAIAGIKAAAFREAQYRAGFDLEPIYQHIGSVAQRIQHATETGRIHGAAILAFRDLTPYRVCALVARVAAQVDSFAGWMDEDAVAVIRNAINSK